MEKCVMKESTLQKAECTDVLKLWQTMAATQKTTQQFV